VRLDFPTIMVLLVVASGLIWALDVFVLARRRRSAVPDVGEEAGEPGATVRPTPRIVEYARSFFPVFLIVLLLRSFLVEPFRIPSGSMMPTLLVGDFILVNKYVYGIRLPVSDKKVFEVSQPQRGDVVVFRYPLDPSTPFIKRVVGLPGDRIAYYNKVLYINGQQAEQRPIGTYTGHGSGTNMTGALLKQETLGTITHPILVQEGYSSVDGKLVVPEGHYFVLGDNRDNSRDSRYWGTVPEELLIGKAFTIWMNWDLGHGIGWQRIGTSIE
jgi:signal peptidase I